MPLQILVTSLWSLNWLRFRLTSEAFLLKKDTIWWTITTITSYIDKRERGWLHFNANVNVQSLRTDDWAISHHIHHHLGTNTTTNQNQRKNVCCSNVATSVLPSSKKIFSNINTKNKKETWIKRDDNHNMKIKATGSWFNAYA